MSKSHISRVFVTEHKKQKKYAYKVRKKILTKLELSAVFFQTIDLFRHTEPSELIDNALENRYFNAKYKPSEIVEELLANYNGGCTCIEAAAPQ